MRKIHGEGSFKMSEKSIELQKKEAKLVDLQNKIKKLKDEIKAKKRRDAAAQRRHRTRNLIQFGAIVTKDLGIDPLSDDDLAIMQKFLAEYIGFSYFGSVKRKNELKTGLLNTYDHSFLYKKFRHLFTTNNSDLYFVRKYGREKCMEDFENAKENK